MFLKCMFWSYIFLFFIFNYFLRNVNILCQILQIFLTLMSHPDVISWNDITRKFVDKMAVYVNGSSKMENNDSLYLSLNIILNVINRWYVKKKHFKNFRFVCF